MKLPKSIVQTAAGAILGAAVTAALMWGIFGPKSDPAPPLSDRASTDTPDTVETVDAPLVFSRDITGECTLLGSVLREDGTPLAGAAVGIFLHDQPWSAPQPPPMAITDNTGAFRIERLSPSLPLSLYAVAEGFETADLPAPKCDVPVVLTAPKGGSLQLSVRDKDNRPAAFARVQVFGDALWPPRQGRTGEDGHLRVTGLEAGAYALLIEKNDQIFASETLVDVGLANETSLAVSLEKGVPRAVTVLDAEQGLPVPNAAVTVRPTASSLIKSTLKTDEQGRVDVLCATSACTVTAASGAYLQSDPVPVKTGGTMLRLPRGAVVTGRVLDKDGLPIKGAEIRVTEAFGTAAVSLPGTEAERFQQRLTDAAADGYPFLIDLAEENAAAAAPLRLALPGPATGAAPTFAAASDEEGRFALFGLPIRRIYLTAEHPEMIPAGPPFEVPLDTNIRLDNIIITMKPGQAVAVRVLDEREVPVLEASVLVFSDDGALLRDASSDTDGYARFAGLPKDTRIEISKDGYIPRTLRTELHTRENDEVEIKLEPADRTMHGRVKDSRGFGVGNVAVTARLTEKGRVQVLTAVTEADGTFQLEGAGEGRYRITADGGEAGGAQALDMTWRDDVKLVLDTSTEPRYADEAAPMIIAPPGWNGGGAIANIGGEYTNAESVGADNLGITGAKTDALAIPSPNMPVVPEPSVPSPDAPMQPGAPSPYGTTDTLSVTGPPPGKGGLPIDVGGGPGKVTVTRVAVGSRVETAGLLKGARILGVNGTPVSGPADAKRALQGPIGSVVMLEVSDNKDGSDPYTIVVQRERIP